MLIFIPNSALKTNDYNLYGVNSLRGKCTTEHQVIGTLGALTVLRMLQSEGSIIGVFNDVARSFSPSVLASTKGTWSGGGLWTSTKLPFVVCSI